MKFKRIERTINNDGDLNSITFDKELRPRIPPARRPGRPKFKWAEKGVEEYWEVIRKNFKYTTLGAFDFENSEQRRWIRKYASAAIVIHEDIWSQIDHREPDWDNPEGVKPTPWIQDEIRIYTDGSCPENS